MTVHPRWRGEHIRSRLNPDFLDGSSPLARGTHLGQAALGAGLAGLRFIPAGAGNTTTVASTDRPLAVHPRWRGEHGMADAGAQHPIGSSPLARGTRARHERRRQAARFIPAGAGNTCSGPAGPGSRAVHPRWRGEHTSRAGFTVNTPGSSPLARGTHLLFHRLPALGRFIPAGAGNTPAAAATGRTGKVHPRWRGEHAIVLCPMLISSGSSPLARGTRLGSRCDG